MLEAHSFHGRQVFAGLRLGTSLVAGDEENRGIHHGSFVENGSHENIVTRAIDKGNVAADAVLASLIDKPVRM